MIDVSDDEGPPPNKMQAPGGWGGRNPRQQQQHQPPPQHPQQPPWGPPQQQPQQSRGGGMNVGGGAGDQEPEAAPGGGLFKTARQQYAADLRKNGKHQQAASIMQQNHAPRAGLTRPRGGGRGGGAAGGGGTAPGPAGKFVPPFVAKAMDGPSGKEGGEEGPLSARTLEMLGVGEDGELPPELQKCDPKLVEQVCNDVIDASGGIAWDDIAGLQTAKNLIREIVVWPMLNPQIFTVRSRTSRLRGATHPLYLPHTFVT